MERCEDRDKCGQHWLRFCRRMKTFHLSSAFRDSFTVICETYVFCILGLMVPL